MHILNLGLKLKCCPRAVGTALMRKKKLHLLLYAREWIYFRIPIKIGLEGQTELNAAQAEKPATSVLWWPGLV